MATPTLGAVAASVTAQPLLQANSNRTEAVIQNASTAAMYIGLGVSPSVQAYSVKLYTDDVLSTPFKGQIFAVWATATGSGMVTEIS